MQHSLAGVFCTRPAQVNAYDATLQTVDVTMALAETIETDDELKSVPTADILNVPVAWTRGGGFMMTMPIAAGDYVTLVFADRSIDKWLKNGGANVDPIDLRRHSPSDAIAIPGGYPGNATLAEAHATKMVIGYDGGMQLSVDNAGAMVLAAVGAATQAVALADDVKTELDAVKTDFSNFLTAVNGHGHAALGSPPSPLIIHVPHTPATVGSTKVSVEE